MDISSLPTYFELLTDHRYCKGFPTSKLSATIKSILDEIHLPPNITYKLQRMKVHKRYCISRSGVENGIDNYDFTKYQQFKVSSRREDEKIRTLSVNIFNDNKYEMTFPIFTYLEERAPGVTSYIAILKALAVTYDKTTNSSHMYLLENIFKKFNDMITK